MKMRVLLKNKIVRDKDKSQLSIHTITYKKLIIVSQS